MSAALSLAPLLLVMITLADMVFGEDAVRSKIFGQLQGLVGTTRPVI